MTQPVRILRSTVLGNRPPAGTPDGSPYVNFAENQFGVVNGSTPVDLLGVPNFSPSQTYQPGTAVAYQGQIWISGSLIPPGSWNAAGWTPVQPLDFAVGFQNSFRNGNMDLWTRGTPTIAASTTGYGPDGWRIGSTGSAATLGVGGVPASAVSDQSLTVTGAAGNTLTTIDQILESYVYCPPLAGRRCVAQAALWANVANVTPQFGVWLPTARDNWAGATNPVPATNLPTITTAGSWMRCGFGFDMPASAAALGALIRWQFPNLGANGVAIAECDVRAVQGAPLGVITSSLPAIECRPIGVQQAENERYYEVGGPYIMWSGYGAASATCYSTYPFKRVKRASPTMTFTITGVNGFPNQAPTLWVASPAWSGCYMVMGATAVATAYFYYSYTASAEIA